jgi:hypothetical protein
LRRYYRLTAAGLTRLADERADETARPHATARLTTHGVILGGGTA